MGSIGRLFVAVGLPDDARHALAAYLAGHLPELPGSVVPPENWHLTIRFLGSVDESRYDLLVHALSEADLGGPFTMRFAGLGAFPRPARASVLWLGVDQGADQLGRLAGAVEAGLAGAGFEPEDRPFHAHLTLTRLRPARDVWALLETEPVPPLRVPVEEVAVYRSHLGGGPARYERLDGFPL